MDISEFNELAVVTVWYNESIDEEEDHTEDITKKNANRSRINNKKFEEGTIMSHLVQVAGTLNDVGVSVMLVVAVGSCCVGRCCIGRCCVQVRPSVC